MKNRKVKLADGNTVDINDNDWSAVVNEKKFNDSETEIVRITRHKSGLLTRVYVMRAVSGGSVLQENHVTPGNKESVQAIAAAAMTKCGLKMIPSVVVP
jgi:hypothetical protein